MPKFIGQTIAGAKEIEPNARGNSTRVPLTYSQARLLPPADVMCSLDTTDRGGPRSLAKRWYRWFAHPLRILESSKATPLMRERAAQAYPTPAHTYATPEIRRERTYQRAEALERELTPNAWMNPATPTSHLAVVADAWEEAGFLGWAENYRAEIERRRGSR